MDFSKWNLGEKVILGSAALAFISFFFNWVDVGILSANGFSQGGVLFIVVFIYPVLMVLMNKHLNKIGGYICAAIGVGLGIFYIASKSGSIFGTSFNAAASGPYVFIVACVLLAFGVFKK